ncbi:MAG: chorismate mutase [Clostridiales bacterium]|jgi:chorismate mutase|nr:chorismate mutase [Clostridiales bacterium]
MTLEEARLALDRIDAQIAQLFYERMGVVDQIAQIKKDCAAPVHRPDREKQVTDRLMEICGPEYSKELLSLYERVFEVSRKRQTELMDKR